MTSVDIVIPAYNEELILETSAQSVFAFCEKNIADYNWKIILLINGSRDNSASIAQKLAKSNDRFSAVIFPEAGLSRSLRRYWLQSKADIVVYMDSDLAVDLEALPRLIKPLADNSADLSMGTRFDPRAKVTRSFSRELISRAYNFWAWLLLRQTQKDLQCGFKAMRQKKFVKIAPHMSDPGWLFGTELVVWANYLKYRIVEIPVDWQETRLGKRPSKVHLLSIPKKFIQPLWRLRQQLKHLS